MSISLTRYVNILSGVAAAANVPARDLIGRIFTANPLVPPDSFVSFANADDALSFFGASSEEYLRAKFYFSWISKNLTKPEFIQFARWVQTNSPPIIFPIKNNSSSLLNWTPITSGSFSLTLGAFEATITGLDFSAAANLNGVATIIQTAIRAETVGGVMWTAATVSYDPISGGFILTGGSAVDASINVFSAPAGTDITGAGLLGWLPEASNVNGIFIPGAIWSNGALAETITEALDASASASNNFGSFLFLQNLGITLPQIIAAATWNESKNVLYLYTQAVIPANVLGWQNALANIGGVGLTISPSLNFSRIGTLTGGSNLITGLLTNSDLSIGMTVFGTGSPNTVITSLVGTTQITVSTDSVNVGTQLLTFTSLEFPEQIPMMIEAATNYDGINTVQNYEFQQFAGITPSVSDDSEADAYDALRVNYYGVTQTAGQAIAFYQRGVLMGLATDPQDMNTYVNEIWLKDASGRAIMTLLLAVNRVPANTQGRNQILSILQTVVNQALNNGTISVGKTLNDTQKMYITGATGDIRAWYQIQNIGYWLDVTIVPIANSNPVQYQAVYTLIYSKDDVIRKVNGTHSLV